MPPAVRKCSYGICVEERAFDIDFMATGKD